MTSTTVRARDKDELARFLGWFSVALGTAQVTAPKTMCKAIGAEEDGPAPIVMRLMGLRELAQGLGILARPRPTMWLWSRVGGDALDLSLLGITARKGNKRTIFAILNTLPIAIADVFESKHLSALDGPVRKGRRIRKAITINAPRDQVESAWEAAEEIRSKADRANADVSIQEAPGDRGVELAVEYVEDPPLGDLGATAAKLTGNDLATELADQLRRLKQIVETGEVTRSDSTPHGHLVADHLKQRPAQPLEEVPA
jgi:uncharacterized membrane protein